MPLTTFASLVLGFGFTNGLRTLAPVAVLCWGARLGWLPLGQTPFKFLTHPASLGVFSAMAVGELIGDKLPNTPPRTTGAGLAGRLGFGTAVGAALAALAHKPLAFALLGTLGTLAGTYGGFHARRWLTKEKGLPDLAVALVEDAFAIGGAFAVTSRF